MRPRPATPGTTKTSPGEEARLLETREVTPRRRLSRWSAPTLARAVQPGQFVHVHDPRTTGLLLPALPVAGYDRVGGTLLLLLDEQSQLIEPLRAVRDGEAASFEGPLGRGFALDARSRYLLVVADVDGFGRVRSIVDEAVASGRQVTVLLGARSVAEVYPSSLLPDEAEYVVATADGSLGHHGSVADLVTEYEAWADQCFAAGSAALLHRLVTLAQGRDARMGVARLGRRRGRRPDPGRSDARRKAWLQLALRHDAGCALGICAGCTVEGADGPVRVCREGPAFAAAELRREPGT
jgi:dihydroorotate dehydrogenase electron transfer subunit